MADDMRVVTAGWRNDEGQEVSIESELSVSAISDLIEFFEAADGVDVYEKGDFLNWGRAQ
jgi:hypothetical protein